MGVMSSQTAPLMLSTNVQLLVPYHTHTHIFTYTYLLNPFVYHMIYHPFLYSHALVHLCE